MRAFEAHDVDGVGGDADEDEPHGVEVEGAPVMLDEHVGVAGDEDDQVDLLGLVAYSDDVLVGQDLQQQHQHGNQVQKVPYQLKQVHFIIHAGANQRALQQRQSR